MTFRSFLTAMALLLTSTSALADSQLEIDVTIPSLDVNPYHKPFVAVWLESTDRKYVTTIALWANDMEWYKDLHQWWRKAGRSEQPLDGVTGATKKPGKYTIEWSGKDTYGNSIAPGHYLLKVEASREEGGREFLKTKVTINEKGQIKLNGQHELGPVSVRIK